MKKIIFCFFVALLVAQKSFAQDVVSPLSNEQSLHIIDRMDIKTGIAPVFHSVQKPFSRRSIVQYALHLDSTLLQQISILDQQDLKYLYNDNPEYLAAADSATLLTGKRTQRFAQKGKMSIYKTPAIAFDLNSKYFKLKINPLLNTKFGTESNGIDFLYQNQRGVEARGSIDDRVHFYSNVTENQSRFPDYVTQDIKNKNYILGAGLYKDYFNGFLSGKNAYDYLLAEGYISANLTRHIGMQFGHGKHFIGDGYRSLFLSDNTNNYLYLKLNTKIWNFNYQNIFGEIGIDDPRYTSVNGLKGRKYFAAHHLSYRFTDNFHIGLFESVVFSRPNHFEFQYLNPVILYRSVEHHVGSPDNAMLGMDGKWNLFKRFSLYGQFLLDELHFKSLMQQNGSWANKYSIQAGIKYIDVLGIDHLDGQIEYNLVRPFTYTHFDSVSTYTHAGQPLAHPLGANFDEYILKLRYQPIHRIILEGRVFMARVGEEKNDGRTYGNDVRLRYLERISDAAPLLQGDLAKITTFAFDASYQLYHNVFLDIHALARRKNSVDVHKNQQTLYFGGGVRINMRHKRMDF